MISVVLTLVLRAMSVDGGADQTSPEDYGADTGDEGVDAAMRPEQPAHA